MYLKNIASVEGQKYHGAEKAKSNSNSRFILMILMVLGDLPDETHNACTSSESGIPDHAFKLENMPT